MPCLKRPISPGCARPGCRKNDRPCHLGAIPAADRGHSRRWADEEGTLERLKALHCEVVYPVIAAHNGPVVKTTDDLLLVEFASVVDAMRCVISWQPA